MIELTVNGQSYPIRGLLFDKDGTLMSFVAYWGKWCETLLRHYRGQLSRRRIAIPEERIADLFGIEFDELGTIVVDYDRSGPLAMASTGDILAILSWNVYCLGLPWHEAMLISRSCHEAAEAEMAQLRPVQPLPGLLPFLEQCRSIQLPMAVVTADETASAEQHLEWMGIRPFFQTLVGHDQVSRGKPDGEMVETACRRLRLHPSEVAVIGDTNGDMRMGKAAGAALTIGIRTQSRSMENHTDLNEADVVIAGYGQLGLRVGKNKR